MTQNQRELAEVFERNERREAEINDAPEAGTGAARGSGQEHVPLEAIAAGARCKIK